MFISHGSAGWEPRRVPPSELVAREASSWPGDGCLPPCPHVGGLSSVFGLLKRILILLDQGPTLNDLL